MKNRTHTLIPHIAPLLCLFLLVSCGNKEVYRQSYTFPNDTWMRFEPHTFEVDIPNAEDCYELYVALDIDTLRFREQSLPLTLQVVTDQGETRTFFAQVMLHSKDGHTLAQPGGDGHTMFRQRVKEYFYFNKPGHHSVSIGQRTSRYEVKGIRSMEFSISKAKLEMPS